ncbi:T9SS type B sorting domain-containing protein [Capnocytophaga bilenii]
MSYFDKVTQGATATFTIKYPLQGTTYIFSDNLGATYSYTYTATGQDFVYINVGAVNTTRRFALKAINGGCTYQTGFDYTINPVTTLQLAYRVEHEWCGSSGAIRFTLVGPGADNSQYNFFCKKKDETNYGAPRSLSGAISLEAGIYNLIAVRGGVTITTNPVDIKVDKDIKTIAFTTTQLPATCASSGLGIKVNVTQANYPVYYTLKDNAGVDIPGKIKQTSNVFTGLAPGTYFVKVENFCGRYENPQPITINSSSFSITHVSTYIKPREYNCDYVDFFRLWFMGTSVTDAYNSNAFSYPFTFKVLLTSPSGKHYTPTYTITNKEDFDTYLSLLPGWGGEGFTIANSLREHRIAKEYGTWQIGAELDMCGVITTYPAVSSDLYNPIENVQTEIDTGGNDPSSCHTTQLRIRYRDGYSREDTPTLDTYLVVDTAPSGFDYAGAGFYQLGTTTNTLLQGKYLKAIRYNSDSFITVVEPRFLRNGDTFRFRLVDATCSSTRSYLMPAVTVNNANPQATNLGVYESGSCDGFTLTGTTKGSIHIIRNYGSPITQIKIVRYNGSDTGNIGSTSLALPYMLNASHHEKENNWYVRDLPFGNYSLTVTNACGKTITPSVTLKGQTYSVTFLPGCEPTVSATIGDYRAYNTDGQDTSFVIQRYDESRQEWIEFVRPRMNFGTYTTKTSDWGLGKKGKFRVIRRVNDLDGNNICLQVLAEKEFKGDLEEPKIVGFGCSNGKYHLVVIPQGGTPSYTYELVHRVDSGSGVTIPINQVQSGDSFFLDLDVNNPNDAYKFKVTDSCPSAKEREITIANVRTPTIEANQRFYCVGQSAQLTVPDLGPNVTIEWYRSDDAPGTFRGTGTTYTIAALAADDFLHTYKVRLKIPSKTVVQGCISDAIQPYQFQDPAVVIPSISPTNAETIKCVEANEDFDIMSIFNIPSMTLPANVTTRVVETTGEIPVMSNDKIKIRYQAPYQRPMGWGTHTFRYEILYPCGTVATHQEAKLTVKPYVNYKPKDVVKICNPNVTLNEVKTLITEGTPTVTTIQPEFHWYTSYANALTESSELPGSTSLDTSNGKTEVRYLRFSKAAYCSTKVYTITIQGEQAVTNKTLSNNGCDITTIASLKALVDPVDAAKVVIYKDGVEQADNALVETNTGYRYAKNVYECVTESATLSFNLSNRLQAKNELVKVCTSLGYRNNLVTTAGNVKDALGAIYTDTSLTIKLYNKREATSADEYTNNDSEVYTYTDLYFKLQKPSWCDSMVYSVRWAQSTITLAETKSITICEEVTVGELADQLQTAYNYQDVYIYKNDENRPLGTNVFVDWNSALYFSSKDSGKCRSIKVPLVLIKNTNVTTATAKAFVVCRMPSETPKVSALKSVITGGDVRIFIRNNNQWYLQADTDNVNTGYSYFYTLQAAGKCPSEKTPLIVNLLDRPTTTPTVSATVTLCPTATSTVVSLTTYVAPLAGHTLQWYDTATATTTRTVPTINTHVTTKTTVSGYVVYVNSNGCESPRAVVTVTVDDTATPTLTAPAPLVIDCKNATASITEWLGTATATDSCGTVSITNNYNAVKPANLCNHSGVVTVTFTATDLFGNAVSETRTITLVHIKANTDSVTIANGANGGSTTITVFDNDKIGTQTATASTVSMTVTTPATGAAGSATPTLNADGTVTVPAGTQSGTYTIGYKICADVVSITVCDNATITIVVGQASLSVVSETFTISNGANGGTTSSVLENDSYNGTTGLAGNASVTLTWTNVPTGIQTHTDGTITVPAGTRSGTYEVGYRLCENLNNNHCAVATATIVVGQAPLQATDNDYVISNGANGGTTSSVLEDDNYNGTTGLVGNASVTLTWDSVPTGIQTHTNGTITVPAGTPSGIYTLTYHICENLNSSNCSAATVTIAVGVSLIVAHKDEGASFSIPNGANGGTTSSVLANDTLNGNANPSTSSVTLTWTNVPTGIQTNTDGTITAPAGTPAGTYTLTYRICEQLNGTNCSAATVTLVVGQASLTAAADTFTVTNGANGGTTSSVLENDRYNGTINLVGNASVTLTWTNVPAGVQTHTDGRITIPAGTASGTYEVGYKLCENLNGSNCSVATATIVVGQATLTAAADTFTVTNGANGGTTSSVLENDRYNGTTNLVGNASVTLTWTNVPAGVQTHTDGTITIPAGTRSGTYEVGYQLCENLNGSNCSVATATIVVGQADIIARNNTYAIANGAIGGTTSNVLENDTYNGVRNIVGNTSVTLTWDTVPAGISTPTGGAITIPAGTPSGIYTFTYTICEVLNSNNCSSATATVAVGVSLIVAEEDNDDTFKITNGANGGTTSSVLANDTLNGVTPPNTASITLHWHNVPTGIRTNTDGTITVPAGTTSGTYIVTYSICEALNPTNCSGIATATVVVGQATLTAAADTFTVTNVAGGTTSSVLANDSYNGVTPPNTASVTLTWLTVPAGVQTHTDGTITIPAGTPSGTYEVSYQLCENLNGSNCSVATATIVVTSVSSPTVTPTITANADTFTLTVSSTTYTTTSNVLTNDRIGTATATVGSVTIQTTPPATDKPYIDTNTGFVVIPSGVATGTYTINYSLCGIAPLTGCSSVTTVTVNVTSVTATPTTPINIIAVPDGTVNINAEIGGHIASVLANDTLEGQPVTTGTVSFTWTTATPTGFTLNSDGTIDVASNTTVGFYTISYTICATRGSDRACATSLINVNVVTPTATPTIEVNGETFTYTGNMVVGNVLTNDKLNNISNPLITSVTLTAPVPETGKPYIKLTSGEVMVLPGTPAGSYEIPYNVCVPATTICGTATVVVIVPAATPTPTPVPIAADDEATTVRNTPVTIAVLANDTPHGAMPNVVTPPLNGTTTVKPDGTIEYTPNSSFIGNDAFVYELCNNNGACVTATVRIKVENKLIVYNGISVDGNDRNRHFHIAGIENYPKNVVRIFNRWGVQVFEVEGYDNVRNVFTGRSDGRVTIEAGDKLPQGTYYYTIEYVDENNQKQKQAGWLYLKRN